MGTSWCCWLPVLQIDDVMFVVSSCAVVLLPGPRAHLRTLRALPSCSEPPAFASLAVSLSWSRWVRLGSRRLSPPTASSRLALHPSSLVRLLAMHGVAVDELARCAAISSPRRNYLQIVFFDD